MKRKWVKRIMVILAILVLVPVLAAVIALAVLQARTRSVLDDVSYICQDEKYRTPVMIEGVEVFEQDVSCGYAVIEMFSR